MRLTRAGDVLGGALAHPRRPAFALPLAASLGMVLPICECGIVPVARQLRAVTRCTSCLARSRAAHPGGSLQGRRST